MLDVQMTGMLTGSDIEDDAYAIAWEKLFLGGSSVLVDPVAINLPYMRHEDAGDLMGVENEEGILQHRDEGGHEGYLDDTLELPEECECCRDFHGGMWVVGEGGKERRSVTPCLGKYVRSVVTARCVVTGSSSSAMGNGG